MKLYIGVSRSARQLLNEEIDKILSLVNLEREHAETHSQRNAYQAVIRHEIEILQASIHEENSATDNINDIPF